MKHNCGACKAREIGSGHSFRCGLMHPIVNIYVPKTGSLVDAKPLEECEKPLSTKAYAELLILQSKRENISQ